MRKPSYDGTSHAHEHDNPSVYSSRSAYYYLNRPPRYLYRDLQQEDHYLRHPRLCYYLGLHTTDRFQALHAEYHRLFHLSKHRCQGRLRAGHYRPPHRASHFRRHRSVYHFHYYQSMSNSKLKHPHSAVSVRKKRFQDLAKRNKGIAKRLKAIQTRLS